VLLGYLVSSPLHPVQLYILGCSFVVVSVLLNDRLEVVSIIHAQFGRTLLSWWTRQQFLKVLHGHTLGLYLTVPLPECLPLAVLSQLHGPIDEAIDINQVLVDMRIGGLSLDDALFVTGLDSLGVILGLLAHQQ
jgi:hypothetical protein